MKTKITLIAIAAASFLAAEAFSFGMFGMMGRHMAGQNMERHHDAMHSGLPAEYAGKTSPLPANEQSISIGKDLYQVNCAACHGDQGEGDGPAAEGLSPKPAVLAGIGSMRIGSVDFLYWTINEGGAKYKSAMPAFKGALSDEDIWHLVNYVKQM